MAATAEWHDLYSADEPQSLSAISLAGQKKLDNLILREPERTLPCS